MEKKLIQCFSTVGKMVNLNFPNVRRECQTVPLRLHVVCKVLRRERSGVLTVRSRHHVAQAAFYVQVLVSAAVKNKTETQIENNQCINYYYYYLFNWAIYLISALNKLMKSKYYRVFPEDNSAGPLGRGPTESHCVFC